MDINKSSDLVLSKPFSNYLGGNTALYETAQTNGNKISGGKRRTKQRANNRMKTKRRRNRRRTSKTRSQWFR